MGSTAWRGYSLLFSALTACGGTNDSARMARPDPGPLPTIGASAAPPPRASEAHVLRITASAISMGDGPPIVALSGDLSLGAPAADKRSGANDLFIVPLAAAFARERAKGALGDELTVVVGRDTPYRMLIEVLFTAGQSELGTYHLVEDRMTGRAFTTRPPRQRGPGPLPEGMPSGPQPLGLVALIVKEGIGLKAAGGNITPGCADVGPGLTLPRRGEANDLAGLGACVAKLKASKPEWAAEREVVIAASASTPFHEVVDVVQTLRGTDAEPLFPTVYFGVAR